MDDDTAAVPAEDNARVKGDFDGDGRDGVAALYDYGRKDDRSRSALWTFNGNGFDKPRLAWESSTDPVKSWNWTVSEPVAGDFDGDGRAELAVMYDYGNAADVRNRTALWSFTGRGTDFATPQANWDSSSTRRPEPFGRGWGHPPVPPPTGQGSPG